MLRECKRSRSFRDARAPARSATSPSHTSPTATLSSKSCASASAARTRRSSAASTGAHPRAATRSSSGTRASGAWPATPVASKRARRWSRASVAPTAVRIAAPVKRICVSGRLPRARDQLLPRFFATIRRTGGVLHVVPIRSPNRRPSSNRSRHEKHGCISSWPSAHEDGAAHSDRRWRRSGRILAAVKLRLSGLHFTVSNCITSLIMSTARAHRRRLLRQRVTPSQALAAPKRSVVSRRPALRGRFRIIRSLARTAPGSSPASPGERSFVDTADVSQSSCWTTFLVLAR